MADRKKYLLIMAIVLVVLMFSIVGYVFIFGPENGPLATVSFHVNGQEVLNVTCEIASTQEERAQGLMNRDELALDRGMLFVYDRPIEVGFWMKNTSIPLDMIFIDENGIVANVEEADVQTGVPDSQLIHYLSDGPVKWVVEINQSLCASNGIGAGAQVYIYESV